MGDIVDRANDLVDAFTNRSLDAQRQSARSKHPYVEGEPAFHCHECTVVIPQLRRQVTGSELCIECKQDLDELGDRGC